MRNIFILIFVFSLILSGCSAKFAPEKFGIIPLDKLPAEYTFDEAVKNGDYVDIHGEIQNENAMTDFLKKVANNEEAFIRKVMCTVEGDPVIYDFYYDGNKFYVSSDHSRDNWGSSIINLKEKEYLYLKEYPVTYSGGEKVDYLILTNAEIIEETRFEDDECIILTEINVQYQGNDSP